MGQLCDRRAALAAPVLVLAIVSSSSPATAGDAFFRGGLILEPRDVDIEGRWRLGFGSDYPLNFDETIFAGFELQTSVFRQDVGPATTATIVPGNGFVNVKVKSPNLDVRPYGGGGLGLIGRWLFVSGETEWQKDFGFHLLGGLELGRLSLELQLQRAFAEGADTAFIAYVGFVF